MKEPPHNLEAERSVLGAVFIKPAIWPTVAALVGTNDFFLPSHREVFQAMAAVDKRGVAIDTLTVSDELRAREVLLRLEGGGTYLTQLANAVPTAENFDHYVGILHELAVKRRLLIVCADLMNEVHGTRSADDLLQDVSQAISAMAIRSSMDMVTVGQCMPGIMTAISAKVDGGKAAMVSGLRTGIAALDEMTCGHDPGDLVVIGADPGSGKTALAVQAGVNAALEGGVCFCANLEMGREQIAERILIRQARVSSYLVRRGELTQVDMRAMYGAADKLGKIEFYVEDRVSSMREFEWRLRACRARHQRGKFVAIFDFLQLARGDGRKQQSRAEEVGGHAQKLKELARRLDVVMIAVSAFNRDHKDGEPPTRKSLRESGAIEYAADTILLLWNKDKTSDGTVKIILEKNRKGPTGTVSAQWTGRHYLFSDVET